MPGPARRAELVAGPTRDVGHVRRLVVERPAERVAEDEQVRVGRPVACPRSDRGASERPGDGRGEAPRVSRDVHRLARIAARGSGAPPHAAASIARAWRRTSTRRRPSGSIRARGQRTTGRRGAGPRRVGSLSSLHGSARRSTTPRVHPDEVRYIMPRRRSSRERGCALPRRRVRLRAAPRRGAGAGFGLFEDRDVAYPWFKVVERALLRAHGRSGVPPRATTPVPWWAVLAAGLSVAVPSSISIGTVMTESTVLPHGRVALYATISRSSDRPRRQLLLLAAIAAAFLTRSQLGVLYLGVAGRARLSLAGSCPGVAQSVRQLWPSACHSPPGLAVFSSRDSCRASPRESLGAYWELWRGTTRSKSRSGSSTTSRTSRSTSR